MPRLDPQRLEPFVGDLFADPARVRTLVAGSLALLAAGLDPRIWAPTLTTVQAAVRAQPELEGRILVAGLAAAILILVSGAIGDLAKARPIIRVSLLALLTGAILSILFETGSNGFIVGRSIALVGASLVFPVALASVALAFNGIARAAAIGIAYAAYAVGQGIMPVLLTLKTGVYWPGEVVEVIAVLIALRFAWRIPFSLPQPRPAERPFVLGTALWASGIVSIAMGVAWVGSGWDNPARLAMVGGGVVLLGVFLLVERWRRIQQPEAVRVERRPVTVALFAGLVIAVAQNVPMVQLPNYFNVVLGFGPFFGVVALAPLFAALVLAGPIAGWLLGRIAPRTLVGGGVVAVGIGNLVAASVIGPTSSYLAFIVPLLVIGAGFVIATTVRTAIIFASVPRGLPATAASLNEASLLIGNRAGILVSTAVVGEISIRVLNAGLVGVDPVVAEAQRRQFEALLGVLGTADFASVAGAVPPLDAQGYAAAYVAGIQASLALTGVVALVGGLIAWAVLGLRDPLRTMWDHRDERAAAPAVEVADASS